MHGFQDLQVYDYLRIVTAILAVVAAYRLARLVRVECNTYTRRLAEWVWVVFAMLFGIFMGTLEAVGSNTDYRYITLVWFTVTLASAHAARAGGPLQKP